jgi:hypothetical protein
MGRLPKQIIGWIGYLRQVSEPTAREFEFCMGDHKGIEGAER